MAILHIGTATTLAAVPAASCSNGDIAYIWLNSYNVKMVYDDSATNATATSDGLTTPYYIRPDDYGAAGVWIEEVGAEENLRLNAAQTMTGKLISTNWSVSEGSEYDLDAGTIKLGGSSAPAFSVTAAGVLTCTGAIISGQFVAITGLIGGFTINATDGLYAGAVATRVQMKPGAGIWCGATAFGSAPFRVNLAGDLVATSATITGAITATSGSFAGAIAAATIDIGGDDATSFHVDINGGIWSGAAIADKATAPFRVSNAGALVATSISIGDANSYLTFSGGAMAIKMASGETFDLLGSLDVGGGGDITLAVNGDLFFNTETGNADSNRALIQWNLDAVSAQLAGDFDNNAIVLAPSSDGDCSLSLGSSWKPLTNNRFSDIELLAIDGLDLSLFTAGTAYGCAIVLNKAASDNFDLELYAYAGYSYHSGFKIHVDEGDSEAYIEMYGDLIVEDNKWIGLGSAAGRIEFDNQATDEINFLDCYVGIGTETPAAPLHLAIDDGALTLAVIEQAKAATNGIFALRAPAGQATNLYFQESTTSKAGIRWDGSNSRLEFWVGNVGTEAIRIQNDGDVGFGGVSPAAQVHIDQSASDGAKPVITVDQADISEEFIKFIGSAANGVLTQSIVDEGDQGSATLAGWLKISVEDVGDQVTDGAYHIPFYTLAA